MLFINYLHQVARRGKEIVDHSVDLLHRWEDNSRHYIGTFLQLFGPEGWGKNVIWHIESEAKPNSVKNLAWFQLMVDWIPARVRDQQLLYNTQNLLWFIQITILGHSCVAIPARVTNIIRRFTSMVSLRERWRKKTHERQIMVIFKDNSKKKK